MDNASKALIMAGAILIAVALVGVGVYLYSSAAGMMNSGVNELASADMMTKNSKIELYEGQITGSELKTLFRQLKTYNAKDIFPTDLSITDNKKQSTAFVCNALSGTLCCFIKKTFKRLDRSCPLPCISARTSFCKQERR